MDIVKILVMYIMVQNTKHRRNKRNKSVKKQKIRGGVRGKSNKKDLNVTSKSVVKIESAKVKTIMPKVKPYGITNNYKCKGNRVSCSVMDDSSDEE
jgi:hypothetical protein